MRKSSFSSLCAYGFAIAFSATAAHAAPAGDAAQGAKLFVQCRACHTVNKGGASLLGPNLFGIVGSKSATRTYKYSPAMTKANVVWTPQKLDAWLARPAAVVPGTKMAFAGVSNPQARASIVAYLATLK